jgi:hypothetical protein
MEFTLYINECGEIVNKATVRQSFELPQGKYLITIESVKKRSLPQNAYYWSVCVPLIKKGLYDIGYRDIKTNDDAHEVMKHLFLKKKFSNEESGEVIVVPGSTASLKTVEFNEYLEEIWQWASDYLNIQIPQPNEQTAMFK